MKNRYLNIVTLIFFITCTNLFFSQDGSLDQSFGNNGKVETLIGSMGSTARLLEIQTDGKIVCVGNFNYSSQYEDLSITRYLINGDLDSSFAVNGIKTMEEVDFEVFQHL